MIEDGWNLREMVVLSVLREAGHDPHKDRVDRLGAHGWATCAKCGVSYWISQRARIADGIETSTVDPLNFIPCSK